MTARAADQTAQSQLAQLAVSNTKSTHPMQLLRTYHTRPVRTDPYACISKSYKKVISLMYDPIVAHLGLDLSTPQAQPVRLTDTAHSYSYWPHDGNAGLPEPSQRMAVPSKVVAPCMAAYMGLLRTRVMQNIQECSRNDNQKTRAHQRPKKKVYDTRSVLLSK
jgi:hypothetical protein